MYKFLLFLHILGAGAWIGAALKEAIERPLVHHGEPAERAFWLRNQMKLATRLYIPSAVIVLVTGIVMVVDNEAIVRTPRHRSPPPHPRRHGLEVGPLIWPAVEAS